MIVSKRGLVKVILLLVIIDIIAALWYLTLRIEASGDSRDLWETDEDREAVVADTVVEATVADTFAVTAAHGYFISQQPVNLDKNSYMASVKIVKARLPQAINGYDSIEAFNQAVMEKAFGHTSLSLERAIEQFCKRPHFNEDVNLPYTELDHVPQSLPAYTNSQQILIYPLYTSHRLLVMEIESKRSNGSTSAATSAYVHYDRVTQRLITRSDILRSGQDNEVLSLINEKIGHLNTKKKDLGLFSASKVPDELCVRKTGISFMFPPGEIAPIAKGEIEIMVSHGDIRRLLTPSFQEILGASTGWWKYKPLE